MLFKKSRITFDGCLDICSWLKQVHVKLLSSNCMCGLITLACPCLTRQVWLTLDWWMLAVVWLKLTCMSCWYAYHLLWYAWVMIKLNSSSCLCKCVVLLWMLCGLHFHAFIYMHCCTSFRYDRCTTWRTWCWSRTRRWCLVHISRRWKEPGGVYAWAVDTRQAECYLTNIDLMLDFRQAPVYNLLF